MNLSKTLTKEQLLEYARLSQMRKTSQTTVKMSPIEKAKYIELAKELGVGISELTRQGMYKSLYHFKGIKQHRDEV
jgi:hypothetical protein